MKATVGRTKIEGYYGPDMGEGRWLFVKIARARQTYSVARVVDGQIAEFDEMQALSDFTNAEVAEALMAAS